VVLPEPVEHREGNAGALGDGIEDPQPGFRVEFAALSGIPPAGFSGDAPVAALCIIIPPGFDGTIGVILPASLGPGARGCVPHALGERETFSTKGFDVANDLEAHKRPTFFWFWCRILHAPAVYDHPPQTPIKRFCGSTFPDLRSQCRGLAPVPKMPANCGNISKAKS